MGRGGAERGIGGWCGWVRGQLCEMHAYMRYGHGRPTPVADNERLIALLHDAAVLQESPSCITISLPAFKGDEWLP